MKTTTATTAMARAGSNAFRSARSALNKEDLPLSSVGRFVRRARSQTRRSPAKVSQTRAWAAHCNGAPLVRTSSSVAVAVKKGDNDRHKRLVRPIPLPAPPRSPFSPQKIERKSSPGAILAKIRINEGKEAEAEAAIKEMVSAVEKNEPGALLYIMSRSKEDPLEVTVFEVYKDGEAHAAHSGSEHMAAFSQYFRDVFDRSAVKIVPLEQIASVQR